MLLAGIQKLQQTILKRQLKLNCIQILQPAHLLFTQHKKILTTVQLLKGQSAKKYFPIKTHSFKNMANLKQDLDQYLLLKSDQKKYFNVDLPRLKVPIALENMFKKNEPENSWLKDSEESCCPKLTRFQRIFGFLICFVAGIFLLITSTFFLPVLLLKARKFVLLYTSGSILLILSFCFLSGFTTFIRNAFSRNRLLTSFTYMSSLLATLYFALVVKSTPFTILCAVAQIISLSFMVISTFSGASTGVKVVGTAFKSAISNSLPV